MADGDRTSTNQKAIDTINPLGAIEKTIRKGVEAVGSHSNSPVLKGIGAVSRTETYYSKLREIKRAYERGNLDEAIVRHLLLSSEIMGVETEGAEAAMERKFRHGDTGPQAPLKDRVITGVFDP